MGKKTKVLVVDDEPDILELLQYNLEKENYKVAMAADGKEALQILEKFPAEIILLDVMMPQMDGIETCREIRERNYKKNPYIIFLTARSEEFTEVAAWEAGGNDYIIKPIKPRALISRINAVVSSSSTGTAAKNNIIEIRDLVIDRSNYTVSTGRKGLITLPKKEFEILFLLASNPDSILNREDILRQVWEEDTYVLSRTVDVHIRKLREKLGDDYIKTIKGVGYMFVSDDV